jgi:hypothetical protein
MPCARWQQLPQAIMANLPASPRKTALSNEQARKPCKMPSIVYGPFCALWPDASLEGLTSTKAKALSWWLSGLTVAADWIGSNMAWFAPCLPEHTLKLTGPWPEQKPNKP